jgi:hypothetical protein
MLRPGLARSPQLPTTSRSSNPRHSANLRAGTTARSESKRAKKPAIGAVDRASGRPWTQRRAALAAPEWEWEWPISSSRPAPRRRRGGGGGGRGRRETAAARRGGLCRPSASLRRPWPPPSSCSLLPTAPGGAARRTGCRPPCFSTTREVRRYYTLITR